MGFLRVLPFDTGIGDRVFLAVASYITVNLLWMRFSGDLSGYIGVALAAIVAALILVRG
jgi:predicted small integral membrane protein